MKKRLRTWIALLAVCSACAVILQAQTLPTNFNYQGRLTDTAGTPLPNGNYQMIFSIWDSITGGNQLWGSGNKTVTLYKGLFTTSLGPISSAALPGVNSFLQVQMGTDTPMPRIPLGSVPYALKAVELFWPAVATISNANPVLTLTNSGAGTAITAMNTGTGGAGYFRINNAANSNNTLIATTNGSGSALSAATTGSGAAIRATPGSGLAGLFEGIIQTNGFKMATGATDGYVLGSDAAGIASWRKDGLALPYASIASTSGDSFSLKNQGTGKAMWLGIDNASSTSPTLHVAGNHQGPGLLVDGLAQIGSFKMATGASNGYVLKSDASGLGSWKAANEFVDLTATGTVNTLGLNVDPGNTNTGALSSGAIRLGTNSGEGIFSKRTIGANRFGLELVTNSISRLSITQSGNVGIGINTPSYKLHVKGVQAGNYTNPLSYIENTNTTGDSGPALRLGGSGNSADGVLNISNFGTGKIAVFGGTGGEVANIDTSGNLSVAGNVTVGGNLAIPNMPAVAYSKHNDDISWNHGDVKYLETIPVKAPGNGYFVITGSVNLTVEVTPAYDKASMILTLYDATNSGSKIYLQHTSYSLHIFAYNTNILNEIGQSVNSIYPVTKGQSVTLQLEGELKSDSNPFSVHTNRSSLYVLFVPSLLTP